MRWSALLALTLLGCTESTEVPDDTDDEVVPTDDSGPEPEPPPPSNRIDAALFTMLGVAVFDDDDELFLGAAEGESRPAEPMGILFRVFDSSGDRFCEVLLSPASGSAERAKWTEEASPVVGFELVPGEVEVTDACANAQLPPEFDGDIGGAIAKWNWGFGIGELDPDFARELSREYTPSAWDALEPLLAAGTLYSNILPLTDLEADLYEQGLVRGYEIDEKGAVIVGGTGELVDIPVDDMIISNDEVITGYYVFESRLRLQGPLLLRDVPDPYASTGDTAMP